MLCFAQHDRYVPLPSHSLRSLRELASLGIALTLLVNTLHPFGQNLLK